MTSFLSGQNANTQDFRTPEESAKLCRSESNLGACEQSLQHAEKFGTVVEVEEFGSRLCSNGALNACTRIAAALLRADKETEASKWLALACSGDQQFDPSACRMRAELADRYQQPKAAANFRRRACLNSASPACAVKSTP
jgi:hypothetical protein